MPLSMALYVYVGSYPKVLNQQIHIVTCHLTSDYMNPILTLNLLNYD